MKFLDILGPQQMKHPDSDESLTFSISNTVYNGIPTLMARPPKKLNLARFLADYFVN